MENRQEQIRAIMEEQRSFYETGKTRSLEFRENSLKELWRAVARRKEAIEEALFLDLGKHEMEAYETEIGLVLSDIRSAIRHLPGWMKEKKVPTPLHLFPGKSRIRKEPYGQVLIMGPFNYPFQLLMEPLIGAMAAGNCSVLKPSELAPHSMKIVKKIIEETFQREYICCVEGGLEENQALLNQQFDYIFFTGSVRVGRIVMEAAARHLTPVTLELGGKSPVVVERTANLTTAAKRVMWGKLLNAGQTCVAPDYVLVDETVKETFVKEIKKATAELYGEDVKKSPDFGRIINDRHYERLERILEQDKEYVVMESGRDRTQRYIGPAVLDLGAVSSIERRKVPPASMEEELFGPLLPILSYGNLKEAIQFIRRGEAPLALYLFTRDRRAAGQILDHTRSGGAAVNDTISHLVGASLPFGGVGSSGMGKYHGKYSFDTFTHERSVYMKPASWGIRLGYPPYTERKKRIIEKILK